jgi:hypothetical protein
MINLQKRRENKKQMRERKEINLSYICLGYFVCLCVCVCVCVSHLRNDQVIPLVLVIKLTKEMRRRV